jgi:hypothetical protein
VNVELKNRFSGDVIFTASLDISYANKSVGLQLGAAVLMAIKARADLSGAYLSGADLSGAYLSGAYLSGANLSGANLSGAYLSRANLSGAYLSGADLSGANLSGAYLSGADLSRANLSGADLSGANLRSANLSGAYLSGAYLSGADLSGANLSGANLSGANLSGAYLSGAKYDAKTVWPPLSIVAEGTLTVWKKLRDGIVAKLEIPAKAKRTNSTGRKCRAEYAKVLALYQGDATKALPAKTVGLSTHDGTTQYKAGKLVKPNKFDPDFRVECSSGIHFFLTRAEAEAY